MDTNDYDRVGGGYMLVSANINKNEKT